MIAISYRRDDSSPVTGRLYDRLQAEFGRRNVFMDFDSIPFGVDFRDKIKHTLERARVVIAVVGPNWAGSRDPGKRRIDDPTDFVRMEIAAALQRGIPVIPVLLDNTVMPSVEDLPEELQPFAFRNALVLDTGVDFHHHADRLIAGIHELVDGGPRGKPKSRLLTMGVIVVLALVAAAALWNLIARRNSQPGPTGPVTPAPHATEAPVTTPSTTTTTTPGQALPLAATPQSIATPTPPALALPSSSPVPSRDLEGSISIPSNFKSIQPSVPQSARTVLNRRIQSADGAVQFAVTAISVRGLAPTVEARAIAIPRLQGEEVTERTPSRENFASMGDNYYVYHEDVTVEGPNHSYTRYFRVDVSTSSSVGASSHLWEFWVRDEQALQTYKEIYRAFKKSVKFKEE
jgi:TIR domain